MNRSLKTAAVAGVAIAGAFAALAPTAANAQTVMQPVQRPFSLKISENFPTDGDKTGVFGFGGTYDFTKSSTTQPMIFDVYADYFGKSDQRVFGGGLGIKYLLGTASSSSVPYVGAGIGVYDSHVSGSSDHTNLGGKVLAGYQFNAGYFGEVSYNIISKTGDYNPSALGVAVGYRF